MQNKSWVKRNISIKDIIARCVESINPTNRSVVKDTDCTSARNVCQKEIRLEKKRLEHDRINEVSEENSSQAH